MTEENNIKTQNSFVYETFLNQKRLTKDEYYEYKKENKKFTDELYPANDNSLYSQNSKGEFNDKKNGQKLKDELQEDLELKEKKLTIVWERISDRGDFKEIYNEKISHEQIEQGSLGDCYLISLIASISHFPKLIIGEKNKNTPHLLYNIEYGDIGYYEIMFFIDGKFKIVIIDDFIPFFKENGITVFAKSSENYFWVNLLEKAYSKICGGYTSMNIMNQGDNKNCYDHFQVFTGYKYERFSFYDEEKDKLTINKDKKEINQIYKKIEENLKNKDKKYNIIITTGTPGENKGIILEENFIPYQHSFSIIDCKTIKINKDKNTMKLLLINNPWGRNVYDEGIGNYCLENLNDDVINLKPYIESNLNSEDGSFWIDYDTFIKNYVGVNLCKIPCDYHCINYSLPNSENFELPHIFKLIIDKKTNVWFNVNIHCSKSIINHDEKNDVHKYLIINQINDEGKLIKTFSDTKGKDDIQENYDLEKGNYFIWLYIPKKYAKNKNDNLSANFMVSSDNKIKIKFLNYDKDFKYIINICENIFNINNEKIINEKEDKLIKCSVDCKSIEGILIVYFKNNTNDKKIDAEPETKVEGFVPIKDEIKIDLKKLKFTLKPNECTYYIGISNALKSKFAIGGINMTYMEFKQELIKPKDYNFSDYINEKDKINKKLDVVKYETNPYCYIKTNFNKNKDKRDEENIYNYFVGLMYEKMKNKGLDNEKIKLISKDIWNKMKEEEKDKIRKKYETKKKELKNNVLKTQILKYIRRNSLKIESKNKIDIEIENMKLKTRLSKQIQVAKFEDDLDELEIKIRDILPKIESLKESEKDEIELDNYITKQNVISESLKVLSNEKITKENGKQIDEKQSKLSHEYFLFSKKMKTFLDKHEQKMKLYDEIQKKGVKISEEINEKIKIYNEKKLDLRKEVNNLIEKFKQLNEEAKKLKLIEIHNKCNNEVIKKQKEIFGYIDKIQNGLKNVVENIKKDNEEIKKKQDEILTDELINKYNKTQNEIEIKINKLKDMDKVYNDITEVINEEKNFMKELETFNNSPINENNIKDSIEKFKILESTHKKVGEKINGFQNTFIPKVNNFNECMKEYDNCKNEILGIYEKFKEKKLQVNESLDKLLFKMKELFDESKNLKILDIINKSKNEMKPNWEKIETIYNEIINKIQTILDKKRGTSSVPKSTNSNIKEENNNNIKKNKEIEEKINKEMKALKETQNELIKIINNLKENKKENLNELKKISEEQDKTMEEIKVVYKNDLKNIDKQNLKDNFEKYKNFNEKYKTIIDRIKKISDKCANLVKSYNEFVEKEFENRKKIFENANILSQNGFNVDENIIKKAEDILEDLKKFKINELNEIFNGTINSKMKNLNEVEEILMNLIKNK